MRVDLTVSSDVEQTSRLRQLGAMFDVPLKDRNVVSWSGDVPLDERPWSVGLIVGPSGCGKTTLAREMFGEFARVEWSDRAAIDDFPADLSLQDIVAAVQSVGFNTVPAWMRPYKVLSNGERFRADMARLFTDSPADRPIVVDEFTSVVDRQVGMIVSHAVQKWVRRNGRQFVAVSCHSDIVDWLQPDWVLEPATMTFTWRSVQPRPRLDLTIEPAPFDTWRAFGRYHYLTNHVHPAAKMFTANVDGQPVAIAAVLQSPGHAGIKMMSRLVTLPDWQGLGIAFALCDTIGAALRAKGWYYHAVPAHPSLVRSYDRSRNWSMRRRGGAAGRATNHGPNAKRLGNEGERHASTFRYCGPPLDLATANRLLVPHLLAS